MAKKANALGVPVKTLKWNPIVRISSEATRSKDWEDVITMHEGDAYVRSWRLQEKKAGRWAMEIEDGSVSVSLEVLSGIYRLCSSRCRILQVDMHISMRKLCVGWIVNRADTVVEPAVGSGAKVLRGQGCRCAKQGKED